MGSPVRRRNFIYLMLLVVLVAVIWASYQSFSSGPALAEKPLSELLTALDQKQVVHGTFSSDQHFVDWTDLHARQYRTLYPAGYEPALVERFHQTQVAFDTSRPTVSSIWLTVILPNAILFVLAAGLVWYLLGRSHSRRSAA